jgi:hypothetical protein
MTVAEMTEEMLRKPDAQLLVEWIDNALGYYQEISREDISVVITAYYEGLEGS